MSMDELPELVEGATRAGGGEVREGETYRWQHEACGWLRVVHLRGLSTIEHSPNGSDWYDAQEWRDGQGQYTGEEEIIHLARLLRASEEQLAAERAKCARVEGEAVKWRERAQTEDAKRQLWYDTAQEAQRLLIDEREKCAHLSERCDRLVVRRMEVEAEAERMQQRAEAAERAAAEANGRARDLDASYGDRLLDLEGCYRERLERASEIEQAARALSGAVERLLADYRTGTWSLEPIIEPSLALRAALAPRDEAEGEVK